MYEDMAHELREAADRLDLVATGEGFASVILRASADMLDTDTRFGVYAARRVLHSLVEPIPYDGRSLLEYGRDEANARRYSDLTGLAYGLAEQAITGALEATEGA